MFVSLVFVSALHYVVRMRWRAPQLPGVLLKNERDDGLLVHMSGLLFFFKKNLFFSSKIALIGRILSMVNIVHDRFYIYKKSFFKIDLCN